MLRPPPAEYSAIHQRLKRREVLEHLQAFLSPLQLTRRVQVRVEECGAETRPYRPGGAVTICYEYIARIEALAPPAKTPEGVLREDMIAGAFVQVMLHEFAHAVFDILQVPLLGREEDAADKLAAFIMLQFGKEVALPTLSGAAWFFEASKRTWTGSDFSDVSGTEQQRFYNYLCIAHGADPRLFAPLLRNTLLKTHRAANCTSEYSDLQFAFNSTIMRHVDPDLLKKVQQTQWLRPDDGKGI